MTRIFLTLFLLISCNGLFAAGTAALKAVRLPSQATIAHRLCNIGLDHFVEKTRIDVTLGDQEKFPLGVALAVELALYDYDKYLKNPQMAVVMQMSKPDIIKAILKDHPEAIEELERYKN